MEFEIPQVAVTMTAILGTMMAVLAGVVFLQTPGKGESTCAAESANLPDPKKQPSKHAHKMFALIHTPFWIFLFGIIVVFQPCEDFDAFACNAVLGALALPLVLQPLLFPSAGFNSPDQDRGFWERCSTKANVWIAMCSFIGNWQPLSVCVTRMVWLAVLNQ